MRYVIFVAVLWAIALWYATTSQSAEFNILSPLPDAVYSMSRAEYEQWCWDQNEEALSRAQSEARKFNSTRPRSYMRIGTYPNDIVIQSYAEPSWGGGPVVVLNPYAKRHPKIVNRDKAKKQFTILDPDGAVTEKNLPEIITLELNLLHKEK